MVIGGAEIYRQALAHADRLLITEIVGRFQGDCYFPPIDPDIWQRVESIPRPADAANPCRMSFDTYRRRAP
jgi:dihydrofolate reductase